MLGGEQEQDEPMNVVILDRDGVIGSPAWDLSHPEAEWRPVTGALEAIARLNHAGVRVVLANNEGSSTTGERELRTLNEMHRKLHQQLARVGGHADGIFFCAHPADARCGCRLPKTGLYREVSHRFGVKASDILVVAGSSASATAAVAFGAELILLSSAATEEVLTTPIDAVATFATLADAVGALFAEGHP